MDEIELVMKIPKEEYEMIVNSEDCGLHTLTRAIAHGTILHKRHGRLIDADKLLKTWYDDFCEFMSRTELNSMNNVIKNAPTIIEADKNGSGVKAVRKVSLFYCVRQKGRVQRGHYATPSAYEKTLKTYNYYTTFQCNVNMA